MANSHFNAGPTRRSVVAAAALAPFGMAETYAAPGRFEDPASRGYAGYSESAMVAFVDPVRRVAASLRICRYPPLAHSWLWCHVLTPSGFLSYVHHLGSCGANQVFGDPTRADFSTSAHGARAQLIRTGSDGAVQAVDFDADIQFRRATDAPLGPGATNGRFRGRFTPTHVHSNRTDTGRREQIGRFDATFEVGGDRYTMRGLGKYHEQAQVSPRFTAPFSYFAYWGPEAAGVAIKSPNGDGGSTMARGATAFVTGFQPDQPSRRRHAAIIRAGAAQLDAELEALVQFSLPIFGETWRGSFVRGTVGSEQVVGQFNDWGAERLSYRKPDLTE